MENMSEHYLYVMVVRLFVLEPMLRRRACRVVKMDTPREKRDSKIPTSGDYRISIEQTRCISKRLSSEVACR